MNIYFSVMIAAWGYFLGNDLANHKSTSTIIVDVVVLIAFMVFSWLMSRERS